MNLGLESLKEDIPTKVRCFLTQKDPFTKETCYLILRKTSSGRWDFTGGGIESSESHEVAILREIKEETHLKSKSIKKLKHVGDFTVTQYTGKRRNIVLFSAEYITPLLPVNISVIDDKKYTQPEHFEFRWVFKKSEVVDLPFASEEMKQMLIGELN